MDQISKVSAVSKDSVHKELDTLIKAVEPGFQRRAAFPSGDLSNEYCLDMYIYAAFRIGAKLIPDLRARSIFVRSLGDKVRAKVR